MHSIVHPVPSVFGVGSHVEWSIVPIVLKPDVFVGDKTATSGAVAADYASYLAGALTSFPECAYRPRLAHSAVAAEAACAYVGNEVETREWYTLDLRRGAQARAALLALADAWASRRRVRVEELVLRSCKALGFGVVAERDLTVTMEEYLLLYGDTDRPDLHPIMQASLLDLPARFMLLCGQEQNSALQVMKAYLRHILHFPSPRGRWLHVTDPDAPRYPDMLRVFDR